MEATGTPPPPPEAARLAGPDPARRGGEPKATGTADLKIGDEREDPAPGGGGGGDTGGGAGDASAPSPKTLIAGRSIVFLKGCL